MAARDQHMLSFHILPGHLSYWRSELGITLAVPVGLVAAELLYGWGGVNGQSCQRFAPLGLCEREICQGWPIAAQTSSSELEPGPTQKGKNHGIACSPNQKKALLQFHLYKTKDLLLTQPSSAV